ncbi:type II toxin-antitoxin system RelE/ParE family toxin [bacterium]|nr:type II toxin-antitoxin system RelE/ParE family toxin [bacterium]
MAYKVKFSASSLKDLKSIQEYICEDNREAAKEIVAHIIEKIETVIVPNPGAGRAGRVLRTRELVISKYPYIVPYQVREDVIYILRVLHTSRKWKL